jgi:hypothetical protein
MTPVDNDPSFRMLQWYGYVYRTEQPNHPLQVIGVLYPVNGDERVWYVQPDGTHIAGTVVKTAYMKKPVR